MPLFPINTVIPTSVNTVDELSQLNDTQCLNGEIAYVTDGDTYFRMNRNVSPSAGVPCKSGKGAWVPLIESLAVAALTEPVVISSVTPFLNLPVSVTTPYGAGEYVTVAVNGGGVATLEITGQVDDQTLSAEWIQAPGDAATGSTLPAGAILQPTSFPVQRGNAQLNAGVSGLITPPKGVGPNSFVLLSRATQASVPADSGVVSPVGVVPGTPAANFTIASTNALDNGQIFWIVYG